MNRSKVKTATVAGGILRWPPSRPNAHGQVGLRGTVYLKAEWSSGPVWPHPNFLWLVQKMKSETQTAVKTWRSPAASKLEGASDKECRWHLGTEKGLRWANTKKAGTSIPHIWESKFFQQKWICKWISLRSLQTGTQPGWHPTSASHSLVRARGHGVLDSGL